MTKVCARSPMMAVILKSCINNDVGFATSWQYSILEEAPVTGLTRNKFPPLKTRARHSLAKYSPPEKDIIWGILGFCIKIFVKNLAFNRPEGMAILNHGLFRETQGGWPLQINFCGWLLPFFNSCHNVVNSPSQSTNTGIYSVVQTSSHGQRYCQTFQGHFYTRSKLLHA